MSSTPARQRSTGRARRDRRQAIVDAALELAGEKPFDEVTIAEVARRAGVSHGLLFYYFADKWAITTEALGQLLAGLRAVQVEPTADAAPRARVETFAGRYLAFVLAHRVSYAALMHGPAIARPDVRALVDDARRDAALLLADLLGRDVPLSRWDELELSSWLAVLDVCADRILTDDALDPDEVASWAAGRLVGDA